MNKIEELTIKILKISNFDGIFPINLENLSKNLKIRQKINGNIEIIPIVTKKELLGNLSCSTSLILNSKDYHFICKTNKDESLERQRFSLAHSIGHIALGHLDVNFNFINDETFHDNSKIEKEANYFAMSLLIPEFAIRSFVKNNTNVREICKYFCVSPTTLKIRLKQLNLI